MVSDNGAGSQLVKALIEAKKKFKPLLKNKVNPHFRNEYADLAAVHDAVDDALGANGLTICQPIEVGTNGTFYLKTELLHVSGESKCSIFPLPGGGKPQDVGSALTYGMRYSICAMLGIAPKQDEDDDGNAAQAAGGDGKKPEGKPAPARQPQPAQKPVESNHWVGAVMKVDNVANGKWMVVGGDAAMTQFGTSTPEHAATASSAIGSGRVSIKFIVNGKGIKVIQTIEPEKKEGNDNGK